jgi:glycerol-3-phosphate dehydrogenase
MGKGVLVQTTLWGNLILGPTAADMADPATATRSVQGIMEAILARCRDLVPSFDAGEVIHSFSGLRAKSSTGDWIVRPSAANGSLVHAAGIDSPGLAGSPAIAAEVVTILRRSGLPTQPNARFNPNRRPIIVVKDQRASTFPYVAFPVRADGSAPAQAIRVDGETPETNVVCRCERVTEAEILDACSRSLPCESSQAVRKRTRAGMGHCQGEFCEPRVRALLARAKGVGVEAVPGRPWPATSILPRRHLEDADRDAIRALVPPPAADAKQGKSSP